MPMCSHFIIFRVTLLRFWFLFSIIVSKCSKNNLVFLFVFVQGIHIYWQLSIKFCLQSHLELGICVFSLSCHSLAMRKNSTSLVFVIMGCENVAGDQQV